MIIMRCLDLLDKSLNPNPQELNELDWKATTCRAEKMAQHLSALANYEGGGFLVFGVNDSGAVIGLSQEESRECADRVGNWARDLVSPEARTQVFTFEYQGKHLLGLYVHEGFDKPVHRKGQSMENSYIRAGGQTRIMTRDEIRRSMMTSRHQRFEEMPATLPPEILSKWKECFDFSEFLKRTKFESSDPDRFIEYLFSHKLVSRVGNEFIPTNLAVVACAKDLSKFPSYERFAVRVTEFTDRTKMRAKRDHTFQAGASLSLDAIVEHILAALPHSEIIQNATKLLTTVIPQVAIREIVINAIMHRDFSRTNSFITVEMFSDRIEITNPGGLLPNISVDRLIDHPSESRNEVLADFMRKLNLAEERGSGVDNALTAIELWGLPPVIFESQRDYFKATILMPRKFSEMSKDERITAVYQHACLNKLASKRTTNSSIRERFKFSSEETTKVGRLISDSVDAGRIKLANPTASKRDFHYVPYWA